MDNNLHVIDALRKTLSDLQPIKPDYRARLEKKMRLEFNYNSNHIEGNTLTYGETELLLIFGKTTGNHELREYEEMKSHDVAFELIKGWAMDNEWPMSEFKIKSLHEILLVQPFWKEAITPDGQATRRLIKIGSYKELANSVRLPNGEIFNYASPEETPTLMRDLLDWYRGEEEKKEIHPVILAALFHYKFVSIHPFDDGNGRLSRLLMNYVLFKHNMPPIIVRSENKKSYLFALNQADSGNIEAFVNYIKELAIESLQLSIRASKGEDLNEAGDLDKKINILKKQMGQQGEELLEETYSPEAVADIIFTNVEKLAREWEKSLKKFESFFVSKFAVVNFESHVQSGTDIFVLFQQQADSLPVNEIYGETPVGANYHQLSMSVSFNKLLKEKESKTYVAGEIYFYFYNNAFEVNYSNALKPIHKRYNDRLDDIEISAIVDELGDQLYTQIEKAVNVD